MFDEASLVTGKFWGEFLDAGDATSVDVGEEHAGERQGEFPRLIEGLSTTTGLLLGGERHGEATGEGTNLMQCNALFVVGEGSLGGDVSSRIA